MRKQTRHRFVATNYNRDERHLPFLLYNFYFMRFAQRRKGKLAKTKIFLSLTSGVCFFALIFENYHTIPLTQNEIHLQLQLKSPIQDDGALVLYIRATLTFSPRLKQGDSCINHHCTATEVVASYTMSDRRYFPCVPRYGMY